MRSTRSAALACAVAALLLGSCKKKDGGDEPTAASPDGHTATREPKPPDASAPDPCAVAWSRRAARLAGAYEGAAATLDLEAESRRFVDVCRKLPRERQACAAKAASAQDLESCTRGVWKPADTPAPMEREEVKVEEKRPPETATVGGAEDLCAKAWKNQEAAMARMYAKLGKTFVAGKEAKSFVTMCRKMPRVVRECAAKATNLEQFEACGRLLRGR